MHMNPRAFLRRVRPLRLDETAEENIEDLVSHMRRGKTLDPLTIRASGQEDGRHRAHAAIRLGIRKVPVIVWYPRRR